MYTMSTSSEALSASIFLTYPWPAITGDGVLQFDEFANLLGQIDPLLEQDQVAEMYYDCVGDDDVIDRFVYATERARDKER